MTTSPSGTDHDCIALHAASPLAEGVGICAATALPAGDGVPEWVHLLPTGPVLETADGRGPYRIADPAKLATESLAAGDRLPIDETHATDLAAPKGEPAPARGWIVELQARADGIWGRVEWTETGRSLLGERAYRFLSPVIKHLKDGTVTAILRAALINTPNLRGLTALHSQENDMDLLAKIRAALGLKDDADEKSTLDAVTALKTSVSTHATQLADIAKAAKLDPKSEATAILSAVTTLAAAGAGDKDKQIVALQAELTDVTGKLNKLTDTMARDKATAAVDAAITGGKVGVKPLRDHYIARHMADPAAVEKELAGMPSLTEPSGLNKTPPAKDKDGNIALNAAQLDAAKALGIDPKAYAKTLAAEQVEAV